MRNLKAIVYFLFLQTISNAQVTVIEKSIGLVGENVIWLSDLETEYLQIKEQSNSTKAELKCTLIDQLVLQKLLLHMAKTDSIEVQDEMVDGEIDRRIRFYASQAGGMDALEKYLGKKVYEYKAEIRPKIKEQMVVQQAQQSLLSQVNVSPTEIKQFYNSMPKDSLPIFESEVEIAQIIIEPKPSSFASDFAKSTIEDIRDKILKNGRDFSMMAKIYSDDPGSKKEGGELGYFSRGKMVPEFEAAAFRLKNKDSISPVIRTKYGYHILQLIDRKGGEINARHILIRPKIVASDFEKTEKYLQEVAAEIKAGKMDWCQAVKKYSEDEETKAQCGFLLDPMTGAQVIPVSNLDAELTARLDFLKEGELSNVHQTYSPDGSVLYRLLYLKSISEPHKADFNRDYLKLQLLALEKKKEEKVRKWSQEYKKTVFIQVDSEYQSCKEVQQWMRIKK
ncbi:MAG: hypothetical protein CNE98_06765 [Bacteroidetes bacterium MED-G17]|nr:MAG: hypothetical protein CNE98_06765 [Bacteroidetes bacterium MED-G17]|tara:strand:+ start:14261 stop:15610 length:1350 start_codon:yes stop_codon:yes gene_type:complete